MMKAKQRCHWVTNDPIYIDYHDNEWGIPLYDDLRLFELLILEGMQAGLNWLTILKRRENYRACLENFNPEKMARYNQKKMDELLNNPGIIRNKLKINAIINNAKAYLQLVDEKQSFSSYLWSFVDNKPIVNRGLRPHQVPTTTGISDVLSKDLKRRGFKYVGSTICYAFMQASGMVNDHTQDCFKYHK